MTEDAVSRPSKRPGLPVSDDDPAGSARQRVLESAAKVRDQVRDQVREGGPSSKPAPSGGKAREPLPSDPPEPALGPSAPPRILGVASGWRTTHLKSQLERRAPSLTPRMTALFGGLFGLATVTTIVALLIQSAPPRDDRKEAAEAGLVGSAASSATLAEQTEATVAPKKRVRIKLPGPWRVADLEKDSATRIVGGAVGSESFIAALASKGVPKDQIYRILKAFDGVRKFDKKNRRDRFTVAMNRADKRVVGFEYEVSAFEIFQAKEVDGTLTASQLDLKIAEETVSGSFYVGKDLARSIEWGGFEPSLAKAIDEALQGRSSVDGFDEGGTVRIIATELTALGDFAKYKEIVALEYKPPSPESEAVRIYTFDAPGARGYFDEKGRQPDGSGWTSPVPGAPRTSPFNPKRMHPVLKKVTPHNGTDYGAPTGTPIYATYRGKVTFAGNAGPCGTMIAIMHPNNIESGYCHMSKMVPGLSVGQKVKARQLIGYVGTTGRSTGPHLHFWTKRDNKFFDSETLKIDGFRVIPTESRDAFAQRKAELDRLLEAIPLPDPPPAPVAAPSSSASPSAAPPSSAAVAAADDDDDDGVPSKPAGPVDHGVGDEGEDMVGPDLSSLPKGKL